MIDLHTHILPGIDDGAKDVETSLKMLQMQRENGVDKVALTPHFDMRSVTPYEFLSRRDAAFSALQAAVGDRAVPEMKLGAEVHVTSDLLSLDLRNLTLGDSDYLLLELPTSRRPTMLDYFMRALLDRGFFPILAHVERYSYFHTNPQELVDLVQEGVLTQVTAEVLTGRRFRSFSQTCLRHDVVQLIASDAHNTTDRAPNLSMAAKGVSPTVMRRCNAMAHAVWYNDDPLVTRPTCPSVFSCKNL